MLVFQCWSVFVILTAVCGKAGGGGGGGREINM